ncbi:MAG: tRNA pseudouridine(38-40) synthase TruA [Pseudomonadota bacterium]
MPRYKLTIEYDGTDYVGWQMQAEGASIQRAIADAVHAFCGDTIHPYGSGRTDAGVHARGQVAHLDLSRTHDADTVRDALNAHLRPQPIAILSAKRVGSEFDARFSCIGRRYEYLILPRRAPLALMRHRAWHIPRPLDHAAMHEAAQQLVGHHDFTTFRAAACQAKSPVKTLDALRVGERSNLIVIHAAARSFLHHQVRSMAGALKWVGEGRWSADDLREALEAKDRAACPPVAPPDGLYFMEAIYPRGAEEASSEPEHAGESLGEDKA